MPGAITSDMFQTQIGVNNRQGQILESMKGLAEKAKTAGSQLELTKIQLELDDLKRQYEVMKSINETLKGTQEKGTAFPQSR